MVRYVVAEHAQSFGPIVGKVIRDGFSAGRYRNAWVTPIGTTDWVPAARIFDRTLSDGARAVQAESSPDLKTMRCPTCRELVPETSDVCPECDEPIHPVSMSPSSMRSSIADDAEGASWLRMHWRPLLAFGAIMSVIMTGITLRYLAPDRFATGPKPGAMREPPPPPVAPTCDGDCWSGEACQEGKCVWQQPNGVEHVANKPGIAGPFALPADVTDAILLDDERFVVGLLAGTEIRSTRTGQALGLITEASQTRRLVQVEGAVYAVGPQHISVLDSKDLRLLKTLELGAIVGEVTVGANGRRALVSLPGAHAIAILSTEFHAELDRIRFGDDNVGPVGVDDTGKHALTTTGTIPLLGLSDQQGGAIYAFDPSKLATEQDRVRAAMLGNPASVLMSPDGKTSFIALRHSNKLRPVEWAKSGGIRLLDPVEVCDQPEELGLVRAGRRGVVRCNRGRTLGFFDLETGKLVKSVEFNATATDMVVTPDGAQVIVALPGTTGGALALVDTRTYEVEMVPLTEPPTRVRLSANGSSVLALSDRAKVAWVIR